MTAFMSEGVFFYDSDLGLTEHSVQTCQARDTFAQQIYATRTFKRLT